MSEQPASDPASTSSAEFAVPRYSSLFTRQAIFVAVMILVTGGGLTIAGYGFARRMLSEQLRVRLHQEALDRKNALLAYIGRQQERSRMITGDSRLLAMLDLYSDGIMGEEDFQDESRALLEDIRRITEPSSSNQVRDVGRQLSIRLIDPDAQIVVETGGSVQPIPQQVLKQFDSGRDQFMLGKPHLHNEYYRIQVAAPITTRARRSFVALIEIDASPLMYLLTERSGLGMTGEFVVGRVKDGQLELMNPLQDAQLTNREISQFPYLAAAVAGKHGLWHERRSPRPACPGGQHAAGI